MKLKSSCHANEYYETPVKPIKSSYIHKAGDRGYQRFRDTPTINDSYKPNSGILNARSKAHRGQINRQQSGCWLQFRNAQKLKHVEELKASDIDDLNIKIQKMISKLSEEVSPYSSMVGANPGSKIRLKTDYTDLSTHYNQSQNNDSQVTLNHFSQKEKKEMFESKIISSEMPDRVNYEGKNQNIDQIRRKYKEGNGNRSKVLKHEKSMCALNSYSKADELSYPSNYDAQFIRFRQKLKENNEKDRRELSRELNYNLNPTTLKEKPMKNMHVSHKKNLDEELRKYEQRINTYNSKKLIGLANEGQIERVPLGDRTNSNNSYLKYSPYSSKLASQLTYQHKLKIKHEEHFESEIEDFEQHEQPLTADFRQLSEKNQLSLLLKNISNQISLDEEFRNCKKWFFKLSQSSKWEELIAEVEENNLNLDEISIRQIFYMKEEEENPFYTPRESEFDLRTMVQLFIKCEEHWFENMVKKYSRERLLQCGFKSSKIDISNRGYLTIQDFVRFINLQIDLPIRNRDMLMIFQRLKSEQYLTFQDLIEVICS